MRLNKLTYQALSRILIPRLLQYFWTGWTCRGTPMWGVKWHLRSYFIFRKWQPPTLCQTVCWIRVTEECELKIVVDVHGNGFNATDVHTFNQRRKLVPVPVLCCQDAAIHFPLWSHKLLQVHVSLYIWNAEHSCWRGEIVSRRRFRCQRSNQKFNQVDVDHAQEWIAGVSKNAGGIMRIANNEAALQRWALSFHWRTDITQTNLSNVWPMFIWCVVVSWSPAARSRRRRSSPWNVAAYENMHYWLYSATS